MARFGSLLGLLLALLAPSAFGQALPAITYPSPGTGKVVPGFLSSGTPTTQQILPAANGATVKNPLTGVIGGKSFPIEANRFVSAANIAKGVGNILKGASLVGAVALLAENARCRFGSEGWHCDWGTPKTEEQGWEGTCHASKTTGTTLMDVGDACLALARAIIDQQTVAGAVSSTTTLQGTRECSGTSSSKNCAGESWRKVIKTKQLDGNPGPDAVLHQHNIFSALQKLITHCPPPSQEFGTGCTTPAEDWQQSEAEKVAQQVAPGVAADPAGVLTDVLPLVDPQKAIETDPLEVTGPATVQQPATTTTVTAPNGQPQTTTQQVTNHITYQGDTFTWSNVTVTTAPDGTVTVQDERPQEEEKSECEKNPNVLGCAELDDVADSEVGKKDIPVTWTVDTGWGVAAQCPAPKVLSLNGEAVQFSYQPLCDYLTGLRPIVLAVSALVAAFIFIAAVRGNA